MSELMLPLKKSFLFLYREYIKFICMFWRMLLCSSSRQKAAPWHYYSGLHLQFLLFFELVFCFLGGGFLVFAVRRGRSEVPGLRCSLVSLQPLQLGAQTHGWGADRLMFTPQMGLVSV